MQNIPDNKSQMNFYQGLSEGQNKNLGTGPHFSAAGDIAAMAQPSEALPVKQKTQRKRYEIPKTAKCNVCGKKHFIFKYSYK